MKFDRTSLGKTVEAISTELVAADTTGENVAATATVIDTKGYESCIIGFHFVGEAGIGNCTATTGVPFTVTEADAADGNYSALAVDRVITDDGTYNATTKALTVTAADISAEKMTARVGILPTKRYVKVTASNVGLSSTGKDLTITALAELGNPTYSTDYFSLDAKPSQA